MAKLEIPSIVVDKGSQPGSSVKALHKMESQRSLRSQRTLSKQEEIDEDDHIDMGSRTDVPIPIIANPDNQQQLPIRPTNLNMLHRSRSHSKVKLLVRSHAMREESPDGGAGGSDCEGEGNRVGRHRLRREGSSTDQTSWSEPTLSRGNSREQYDASNNPIDLHQFIVDTLNRNYKDRMLLFKIEGELLGLARDSKRHTHKFNQMSSYQRMLVHRVAAYFGMEHNVDNTGMSVVVNTTKTLNIPERRFRDFVREDLLEEPRRSILKRDSSSFDETGSFKNGDKRFNGDSRRSRSFEEREEEYEKVRRRIFNHEHLTDADLECMEEYHNWENEGSNGCPRCAHNQPERNVRLLKVESYESGDTLKANSLRLSVSKSHSFNGYDQNNAQQTQPTRVLTKQGSSMSSRISPSSSGYKSQRSDATLSATPSPSATPSLHTQTGQPYTNADGSIYHYDPANPPQCMSEQVSPPVPSSQPLQQAPPPNTQPPPPPPPVSLPPPASLPLPAPLPPPPKQVVEEVVGNNEKIGPNSERPGPRFEAIPGYAPVPASPTGLYTAAYAPPPPPQHQLPLVVPPHPPDQYHIYQTSSHHCPTLPAPQPEPRLPPPPDNGAIINNDLSACMMGMALESRPDRQQPIMYWQPHHIQSGVPMYYSGGGHTAAAAANATRYHQAVTSAPPFTSIVPHQIPPPPPPSVEHTVAGSCYGTTYSPAAASPSGPASPECIPPYPSTIHTLYYPTCTSAGSVSGGSTYYASTNVTPGAPHGPNVQPLVAAAQSPTPIPYQPAQPCGHPPSPQNVCSQLTVYNGCYPATTHYAANPATIAAVPQIFRKPSLQVGVGCNSPMRAAGYPMTSSVKERSIEESKAAAAAMQPTLPPTAVYGIRVLPAGDMRLFNTARLPFSVPGSKPIRKPRGYSAPHHVSHFPRLHQNGGQDIVWNSNKPQRGLPHRHDAHLFHRFKMNGGGVRNFSGEGASHSGPPMSGPYVPATSADLTKA